MNKLISSLKSLKFGSPTRLRFIRQCKHGIIMQISSVAFHSWGTYVIYIQPRACSACSWGNERKQDNRALRVFPKDKQNTKTCWARDMLWNPMAFGALKIPCFVAVECHRENKLKKTNATQLAPGHLRNDKLWSRFWQATAFRKIKENYCDNCSSQVNYFFVCLSLDAS